jgi:trans-aconitate 2-methyltransferase
MAQRWPAARVIGSDSSQAMLDKAASTASSVEWRLVDLVNWQPDATEHDVIYGNAVLHWLDDHEEVFPRLVSGLTPGGQLAVQMPLSWWQPSHQVIREALATLPGPEAEALSASMAKPNVYQPHRYYEILHPIVGELDIWETTYQQILTGDDPVFDWVSGSILRPVFTQLPPDDADRFSALCRRRLRAAYPQQLDGTTLFPFHRLFIVARR